jgi:hypothetical protein
MSDLLATHTKLDAIIDHVAGLVTDVTGLATAVTATRDDLAGMRAIVATKDDLAGMRAIMATQDDLAEIRRVMATRADLTEMRAAIMSRIDRLQDAATIQHHERIVDVASSERAERYAKAARDDVTALGEVVTPLIRVVHGMRTQLDDLAEQVRVLKEGRAA